MKYGDVLPPGFNIPASAFWLKGDLTVRGNPFKHVTIHAGDTIMDCGAYIGTFTAACMEQGAADARCYEAAPQTAIVTRQNLARYGDSVQVVEAALIATDDARVDLMMSGLDGANSILPSASKRKSINVPAVNFRRQLVAFNPTVVKLDVEGAEYDLLDSLMPGDLAGVRCLFVEFHPIESQDQRLSKTQGFIYAEGLIPESRRRRAFVALRDASDLFKGAR